VKTQVLVAIAVAGLVGAGGCKGNRRRTIGRPMKMPSTSMEPTFHQGSMVSTEKLDEGEVPARGETITFHMPCSPERQYVKRVVALAGDTVEMRCRRLYVNGKVVPAKAIDGHCTYDDRIEETGRVRTTECSRYHETLEGHEYDVFQPPEPGFDTASDTHDFPQDRQPPSCLAYPGGEPPAHEELGKIVETKPEAPASPCEPRMHYVVPANHVFTLGDNRGNSNDSRYWGSVPLADITGLARAAD
jgi:signal peptidase I